MDEKKKGLLTFSGIYKTILRVNDDTSSTQKPNTDRMWPTFNLFTKIKKKKLDIFELKTFCKQQI